MPAKGLEQFQHALVVAAFLAGERPDDGVWEVKVADLDGVGVAHRAEPDERGRPRADPRNGTQPCLEHVRSEFGRLLEAEREPGRPPDGVAPLAFNPAPVQFVPGEPGETFGARAGPELHRPGRDLAEPSRQKSERSVGERGLDLLTEYGGKHGLHHPVGAPDPRHRPPGEALGQEVAPQPVGVVAGAEEPRRLLEEPLGTGPVRHGLDTTPVRPPKVEGTDARRRDRRPPELPTGRVAHDRPVDRTSRRRKLRLETEFDHGPTGSGGVRHGPDGSEWV